MVRVLHAPTPSCPFVRNPPAPLIACRYGDSFFDAAQPWSGHYEVKSPVWTCAHTTQFTERGWNYLRHGAGVGHLAHGGTYVTLVSPDKKDFSIVLETMTLAHSKCIRSNPTTPWEVDTQQVTFRLTGGLATLASSLTVWKSVLFAPQGQRTYLFERQADLSVGKDGTVTLSIEPDAVVTLSTTRGQQKGGTFEIPAAAPFPLPYHDDFEANKNDTMARYLSDQCGSFSVVARDAGSATESDAMALQQSVRKSPTGHGVGWGKADSRQPITIFGDYKTSDQKVKVDVAILEKTSEPGGNNATNVAIALRVGGKLQTGPSTPESVQAYSTDWYVAPEVLLALALSHTTFLFRFALASFAQVFVWLLPSAHRFLDLPALRWQANGRLWRNSCACEPGHVAPSRVLGSGQQPSRHTRWAPASDLHRHCRHVSYGLAGIGFRVALCSV